MADAPTPVPTAGDLALQKAGVDATNNQIDANRRLIESNQFLTDQEKAAAKATLDLQTAQLAQSVSAQKVAKDNDLSNQILTKSKQIYEQVTKGVSDFSAGFRQLRTDTSNIPNSLDNIIGSASKLFTLMNNNTVFSKFADSSGAATNTVKDQFDDLIKSSGGFQQAIAKLSGAGSIIPKAFIDAGEGATKKFLAHAASAQALEQTYLNLAGSTGQLNNIFDSQNKIIGGLDDATGRYTKRIASSAEITHQNYDSITNLSNALMAIPGALDGISNNTGLDKLTSSATLAAGAMRSNADIAKVIKLAYEDLGNPIGKVTDATEKGENMFNLISQASEKLGLRFDDTEGFLTTVAQGFKNIGDNTQGATNILSRFTGALQQTGLTASASVGIIANMVNAVKNLGTGTEALISQRNGGPGGLQGSFQIEQLLRQGKSDQVAQMTERALRQQFGGRIYTQAEAAASPQAAAQFQRQRATLQSGAFGSLANNKEDATRLLEALAKGGSATSDFIKASDATKTTQERGISIQEKQTTILQDISNSINKANAFNERSFSQQARDVIGSGNSTVRGLIGETRLSGVTRAAENEVGTGRSSAQNNLLAQREATGDLFNTASVAGSSLKKFVIDSINSLKDGFQDSADKIETRKNIDAVRSTTPMTSRQNLATAQLASIQSGQETKKIEVKNDSNVTLRIIGPEGYEFDVQSDGPVKTSVEQNNDAMAGGGAF